MDNKKSLGQHWLNDLAVLSSIVEAANVVSTDYVLEIGPGLGTLTDVLVDKQADILALEFDNDLIAGLNAKFNSSEKVTVTQGDVRTFDYSQLPANYKVVANIPYYLTSHLIRSLSEAKNPPSIAVLLIQKEVAQRLCAGPGQMGILSVTAQFYFDCSLDIEVPAHLFTPPPKVDSQVVVLTHRKKPLFDVDPKLFFQLVKAGFSNKRKTLRNSLSGGLQIEKEKAELLLNKAEIDPKARAQQLSLSQWYELYKAYIKKA